MSLCINPYCTQRDHPDNDGSRFCQACGSDLVLQGRYRVMRLISDKSGFGLVYEAYERSTPKILKVLKEVHSRNPKAVELFQQEASVLSQLHHPGIPAIEPDGYFQFMPREGIDPLHCIIMEKIDGPNLREWMLQQGNHPISERQALKWLQQLAEILHLVHQKNYFHRDIKPENIMLRSSGQVVLVDFGAAREMTFTYLAQLGSTAGVTRISSAGYTPPEQEKGQAVPQSDFYALGCTFIYLLTAKQPTDPNIYDSLYNVFNWRSYAPQVSSPLADFIDQLIAPRANDRPKDTDLILEKLDHLTQIESAASHRSSGFPISSEGIQETGKRSQTPDTHLGNETVWQTRIRPAQRWLLGGVAALLLGVGGMAIWQIQQSNSGRASANLSFVETLTGHTRSINRMVFLPGQPILATGSADKTIKLWDLTTGNTRTLEGHSGFVNVIAVSPDGRTLVSGDANGNLMVWNLQTGAIVHPLKQNSSINALAISPDGQTLVSGNANGSITTWNLTSGAALKTLADHTSAVNAIAISPDGQTLASAGADKTIRLWNLATGKVEATLTGHMSSVNSLIFSPDGQTIVSSSADDTIKLWSLAERKELHTFTGHTSYVNSIAISPDGKLLLSSSADKTIKVWNLTTYDERQTFQAANVSLEYFVISPDWQTIATREHDATTIEIWQLPDLTQQE